MSYRILPVKDETDSGSEEHFKYLNYVLELFCKTWDNVVWVVRHNCNANNCVADFWGAPFMKSASHSFNLAVRDVLKGYENTLFSINALISKLMGLLVGAKFRRTTQLVPRTPNHTQRSSNFQTL